MVALCNPVFERLWNLRLRLQSPFNEIFDIFKQLKRHKMRVNRVSLIKKIEPLLLFECSKNKLFLFRVSIKEIFAQEHIIELTYFVDVVKNAIYVDS